LQNVEENTLKKNQHSEKCWNILQNVEENTLKKNQHSEKFSTFRKMLEQKNVGTSDGGKERQVGGRKRRRKLRWTLVD
jgi:hypothetical protein